jgi:hypothetical protein
VWQGFISSGNPDEFLMSRDTLKNVVNELETLLGDAILVSSVNSLSDETQFVLW